MTPLTQQLEYKKKGCKEQIEKYDLILKCGDWIPTEFDRIKVYCPKCQEIIAILEQAIAEMEKQRQEILDKIDSFINYANQEKKDNYLWYKIQLENLKQQLNQPKTEQ